MVIRDEVASLRQEVEGAMEVGNHPGDTEPLGTRSDIGLLERILVPLDRSIPSETVLRQVQPFLCGGRNEAILFHARTRESALALDGDIPEIARAEEYLDGIAMRLKSGGGHARRLVLKSGVAEGILQAARSERATLVAMSTHGQGTPAGEPYAGTVEQVLCGSRTPLFLARGYEPSFATDDASVTCLTSPIRRILVPLDGLTGCETVMPYARELGLFLGAMIVVLHVAPSDLHDPESIRGATIRDRSSAPDPGDDASPEQRVEHVARAFSTSGLNTMVVHLGGEPVSSILSFARPSAVDLIAMTTHRRIGPSGLQIGSIAVDVMREAILPTLLVRADSFRHNVESNVSELMT